MRAQATTAVITVLVVASASLLTAQLYEAFSRGPIELPEPPAGIEEPAQGEPFPIVVDPPRRPNFLIILSDDQRYDSMWAMPQTRAFIFEQGAVFEKAYVTTPLCCPSRASILTGLMASNHGVWLNPFPLEHPTFFEDLQREGYRTGLIGKYLNSHDGSPRPGFDTWVAHPYGTSRSFDPEFNIDGKWQVVPGHITSILRDHVLAFVGDAAGGDEPFALLWSAQAPHWSHDPPAGDRSLYTDLEPWRPPSYNEADVSDKPRWLRDTPPLTPHEQVRLDNLRIQGFQSLASLDHAIGLVVGALHELDALDDTVVIYLSDHGIFLGEHRLTEKNRVYEEAIHIPMAIRYPPLVPFPTTRHELVANIDVAATIYELANVTPSWQLDGRSLVGLLTTDEPWREHLLLEGWYKRLPAFRAVHDGTYVYIENSGDRTELYDLDSDPYQLSNRAGDAALAGVEARLRGILRAGT